MGRFPVYGRPPFGGFDPVGAVTNRPSEGRSGLPWGGKNAGRQTWWWEGVGPARVRALPALPFYGRAGGCGRDAEGGGKKSKGAEE